VASFVFKIKCRRAQPAALGLYRAGRRRTAASHVPLFGRSKLAQHICGGRFLTRLKIIVSAHFENKLD
jgi:hypothetical protein